MKFKYCTKENRPYVYCQDTNEAASMVDDHQLAKDVALHLNALPDDAQAEYWAKFIKTPVENHGDSPAQITHP